MQSDATQSEALYKVWAWAELHKMQLIAAAAGLVVIGLAVGLYTWQSGAKQEDANEALSALVNNGFGVAATVPDALLKMAQQYTGTGAGGRALLLAGSGLFSQNRFQQAQDAFQKYLRQYPDGPFSGQAMMGVASCLDATGRTNEAVAAYNNFVNRYPNDPGVPQAKFALARLYEGQGNSAEALKLLQELAQTVNPNSSIGNDAGITYEELRAKQPQPAGPPAAAPTPSVKRAKP